MSGCLNQIIETIDQNVQHDELIAHMKYLSNNCNTFLANKLLDLTIYIHCTQPSKGDL